MPGASEDPLQEVVVTGSRIAQRRDAAPDVPLTVLSATDLVRGGRTSVGEALQALPQNTGSPVNTNVNNGGDGSVRVSLRGLGPNRTLVLLNGRRFPNGGLGADDAVDVNSLPVPMVERIDVLNAGATAIYGADAVAGVVNVVTSRASPGVDVHVQERRASRGDGRITNAWVTAGTEFGPGAWTLGAEWVRQEGVSQGDRPYSEVPLVAFTPTATPVFAGSNFVPGGTFSVPRGNALGLPPGTYTRGPANGTRDSTDFFPYVRSRDGFNFAPYNFLQTPNERYGGWLLGAQPLGDAELYVEGLWQRRTSSQRLAPPIWFASPANTPVRPDGSVAVPATNWYNPFGVDVGSAARRFVEVPDRSFARSTESWRALGGARGEVAGWQWDASYAESRSVGTSVESGLVRNDRLLLGLGPSGPDANGRIVCGLRDASGRVPAAAVVPGCVPVDVFGGAGSIGREQLDFVTTTLTDRGTNRQRLANVTFTGAWLEVPAGELRWAAGAEYRRDAGSYRFDAGRLAGTTGESGGDVPGGVFSSREVYAEVRVPLATERLDLTAGARWLDYSSFGSSLPWQAGLAWRPAKAWLVRGQYARVIRAPSLRELYTARTIAGGLFAQDPCGRSPTPTQQANCAANGVPGGQYVVDPDASYAIVTGGNADLQPERGASSSVGVEFRPAAIEGLALSFDAFRVAVDGYVEAPAESDLLTECADRGTPAACAQIKRFPTGALREIVVLPQNYGRLVTEGIDHAGQHAFALAGGTTRLTWRATWLGRYDVEQFAGGERSRQAGRFLLATGRGLPRWRALGAADWQRGAWSVAYQAQWIGGYETCGPPLRDACRPSASVLYHDLESSLEIADGLRLRAGVDNATDRDPPYVNNGFANTDPQTYRLLGRVWYVSIGFSAR